MAVLITGLQGSGKSYYAMYKMFYDQDKFHKIFTNLDGLKQTDKIVSLNFKNFTDEILTECHNLVVTQSKAYKEVIEYLQKIFILPMNVSKENRILLVIDEAQNYFNKKNPILAWFITQHRHLYIELFLITQKYTLLHSDYHLFNLAYNAFPPVKQFSKKSIAYNEYAGLPLNDDNFVRKLTLKKEDEVFDMYISGDKVDSPFILKRFLGIFLLALTVVAFGVYYFVSKYGSSSPPPTSIPKTSITNNSDLPKPTTTRYSSDEDRFYTFVVFEDRFYIQGVGDHDDYPLNFLIYIKEHYFKTVIEKVKHDSFHTSIYVICSVDMEKLFEKSKKRTSLNSGVNDITTFH
jgi:zona occludens toxin